MKKKVYPCKPHFFYIKVGFKGVYCFPDSIKIVVSVNTVIAPIDLHWEKNLLRIHKAQSFYVL